MKIPQSLLAITPGEPAGIGPEILLKLAQQQPDLPLLAVADAELLRRTAAALKITLAIHEWQPGQAIADSGLACLHTPLAKTEIVGQPDPANAAYVLNTLRQAVALLQSGTAGALVTGPVNKAVINQAGIPFTGHTEFLAALAGIEQVVMMLAAPGLRVTLVTTHLPLRAVADAITTENVERCIRITANDLRKHFGIAKPRLQVLGLNPHAGEGGHLGHEDDAIIAPAIARCRADGIDAIGPVPADTAFNPPRLQQCDAVVAMYHDQGLPVLKHAGFGRSVNVTLGLPFIRTSVDHGTALDIAGQGIADASSLGYAVLMAREMIAGNIR
ncbi:MAG: 4-hydroxythreonine-4-phosphate dehydrogenase PdxA [Xanthomonadales bacterium]|nr:4-hydroxythreonine-4-phosphate dehydrogenase PdxA [Xanthomonadales bacterium]